MLEVDEDVPLVRRARCSDCAFTPGTLASQSPTTAVKVAACVETGAYFYCHRNALDTANLPEGEALCAGFVQAVTARIRGGEYDAQRPEDRAAALNILDRIEEIEEAIQR